MFATGALAVLAAVACAPAATRSGAGEARSAEGGPLPYNSADASFMTDMIHHHAQALLMAGWAPGHDAGPSVRTLSERIVVSQQDEIALASRWLGDRGEPVPDVDTSHDRTAPGMEDGAPAMDHVAPGMDHGTPAMDHAAPPAAHSTLMPGMLTAEELAQLDQARGAGFDSLFLTFMIRHHQGAITMVDRLFDAPGAVQDETVFRFAADVHADQAAEVERMSRMLAALPAEGE